MSEGQGLSRLSRAFDRGVVVVGALVALVVVGLCATVWEPRLTWTALAAAAIVPVLTRFHLIVTSSSESVEISFDSAVLVFLLVYLDPLDAMALWVLAGPVAAMSVRKRWPIRLFNAALVLVCGGAMAGVHVLLDGGARTSGRTALAVLLGCAVYVGIDLVLSWVGASLETRTPIGQMISANEVLVAVGVLLGVASLGYLAALLASEEARWLLVLVLMPVLAVVVASRAARRSRSDQRRLNVLLDSARQRRDLDDAPLILEAAVKHAGTLLETDEVEVRPTAPGVGEVGALLDTGGQVRWLVGTLKADREHGRDLDQQALEALAGDTAESLARSRLIHELERLAGTDALTGLVNRSVFADEVARAVAEAGEPGRCPPAVMYLDLDGFKQINDRFGHHVGDLLVCEVADQLRACVRPTDVVARLGGDEFAVLVEGLADTDALLALCQRIVDLLRVERVVDGNVLTVGASLGLAVADATTSADDLLRNADMAMYDAKSRRRPVPAVYRPELRERSVDRAELEDDLRRALGLDGAAPGRLPTDPAAPGRQGARARGAGPVGAPHAGAAHGRGVHRRRRAGGSGRSARRVGAAPGDAGRPRPRRRGRTSDHAVRERVRAAAGRQLARGGGARGGRGRHHRGAARARAHRVGRHRRGPRGAAPAGRAGRGRGGAGDGRLRRRVLLGRATCGGSRSRCSSSTAAC